MNEYPMIVNNNPPHGFYVSRGQEYFQKTGKDGYLSNDMKIYHSMDPNNNGVGGTYFDTYEEAQKLADAFNKKGPNMEFNETGTLVELKVQPGDVVENMSSGKRPEILLKNGEVCYNYLGAGYGTPIGLARQQYRLISRAADTPKTWGEMTDAEKGALLLAYHEGKVIEWFHFDNKVWTNVPHNGCLWDEVFAYRIKPEPKRETVTMYGERNRLYWGFSGGEQWPATYRLSFDTLDDKPICGVYKNQNGDIIKLEEL